MASPSSPLIARRVEGHVGYLTMNAPTRLNAFNLQSGNAFVAALEAFGADPQVRSVVIAGAGRLFSVGGDVRQMGDDLAEGKDPSAYFGEPLAAFNRIVLSIRALPKPVLAAVHGAVAGVAFNVMLACDIRIAMAGTRFAQAFVKLGLSPDGGGSWFLPRLVGYGRACELAMLPTQLDAETALQWGIVNRVVAADLFEVEVKKVAEQLAAGPTLAIAQAKSLFNSCYERSLPEQVEAERRAQVNNGSTDDFREGVEAFLEKREPNFKGR